MLGQFGETSGTTFVLLANVVLNKVCSTYSFLTVDITYCVTMILKRVF